MKLPRFVRVLIGTGFLAPNPYKETPMLEKLKQLVDRIVVILKAAPTYLVLASTVLTIIADELAKILPTPWADRLTALVITVTAALAAIVAIIRRVTPVAPAERGILPVKR